MMNDDLISRKALLKQIRLMANRTSLGETKPAEISGLEVCGLILNAPVVNAIVKPCEVGDTVYRLLWSQDGKGKWNFHIVERRINHLHDIIDCIEGLGKIIFLTKEAAEAALEKESKRWMMN